MLYWFQGIFSKVGNRHTLLLPEKALIDESRFGIYTCNATNKYGSDEKTTEVSGKLTIFFSRINYFYYILNNYIIIKYIII